MLTLQRYTFLGELASDNYTFLGELVNDNYTFLGELWILTKKVAPNVGMPLFAQEGVSNVTAARPEG